MQRHMAGHVRDIVGGERARHFTAKRPVGMFALDSGTPSFPTPPHIREAAKRALDDGLTAYALGQGDPEFLAAVCETVEREAGAGYSPDSVFATNGASSGIYTVFTAFLDRGDEVILLDYHIDVEAVRAAVTSRTKLILVNNPNNPTGVVYRRDELQALADLCAEKDLLLDEPTIEKGMAIVAEVFSHLD